MARRTYSNRHSRCWAFSSDAQGSAKCCKFLCRHRDQECINHALKPNATYFGLNPTTAPGIPRIERESGKVLLSSKAGISVTLHTPNSTYPVDIRLTKSLNSSFRFFRAFSFAAFEVFFSISSIFLLNSSLSISAFHDSCRSPIILFRFDFLCRRRRRGRTNGRKSKTS